MQKGFSSILILLVSFAMIAILGVGIWYYLEFQSTQKDQVATEVPTVPMPQVTESPTIIEDLPQDWITTTSASNDLSFAYPPDAQVSSTLEGTSITIQGPTQTPNTELFDGLSLTISTAALNGRTLQEVAQTLQSENAAEPVVESITQIQQSQYAGKTGYVYTVTSLGTRDIYILPLASDLYLKVINSTVDPTGVGFQETAEDIVATIQEN